MIDGGRIYHEITLRLIQYINIGPGIGLVPSGDKPLPEPMLTQVYVAIWHQQATMS